MTSEAKDASWILVLNANSSSLKFSLFHTHSNKQFQSRLHSQVDSNGKRARLQIPNGHGRTIESREISGGETRWHRQVLNIVIHWLDAHAPGQHLVVSHRVVHGRPAF